MANVHVTQVKLHMDSLYSLWWQISKVYK